MLGVAELVVTPAEVASAQARITDIQRRNTQATATYRAALAAYEKALEERQRAIAARAAAQAAYQAALQRYETTARGAGTQNSMMQSQYNVELAAWRKRKDAEYAYGQAVSHKARVEAEATALVLAKWKVPLPAGYTGCLSPDEKASLVALCAQQSKPVTVKGFGAIQVTPQVPACAYAELPACGTLPPRPPAAGPEPTLKLLPMPTKPLPPPVVQLPVVPPKPTPPTLEELPRIVVRQDPPPSRVPDSTPDAHAKGFATAGLIGLVVVGGATTVYLLTRKKKVA
jgi:hypothetical protein